jgi:predicted RNA-binding protein Jag
MSERDAVYSVVEAVGATEKEAAHRALREMKALPDEIDLIVHKQADGTYYARATLKERKQSLVLVEAFLKEVLRVLVPEAGAWIVLTDVTEHLVRYNVASEKNEGLGALIGKRGATLRAVQAIARELFLRKQDKRKVIVDAGNYLRKHERSLREFFQNRVSAALQEKKEQDLGPLPREDRELIYEWARVTPEVDIRTVGPEHDRHIIILPKVTE